MLASWRWRPNSNGFGAPSALFQTVVSMNNPEISTGCCDVWTQLVDCHVFGKSPRWNSSPPVLAFASR
jgi:hypothetical protein